MVWNPLDWTAGSFLFLYFTLWVCLFIYGFDRRSRLGPDRPTQQRLTELELGYLAGGATRVGDMLLLSLLRGNGAAITPKDFRITVSDQAPMVPLVGKRVALDFEPGMRRIQFQKALAPLVKQIEDRMRLLGLSPTSEEMLQFVGAMAVPYGLLLVFGLTKVLIGSGRGHPVGFLVGLIVLTLLSAAYLATRPRRTQAGSEVLNAYKSENKRAARAPLDHELLLAVALSGTVILSGTSYAQVHAAAQTLTSSGGGDSGGCGGGGCGGGGCGGCS